MDKKIIIEYYRSPTVRDATRTINIADNDIYHINGSNDDGLRISFAREIHIPAKNIGGTQALADYKDFCNNDEEVLVIHVKEYPHG